LRELSLVKNLMARIIKKVLARDVGNFLVLRKI